MPSEAQIAARSNLRPPWQPGQSANAFGVQKGFRRVLALARKNSVEAMETVLEVMRDPNTPPATRLTAAITVIERAWGKAALGSAEDGDSVAGITLRIVAIERDTATVTIDAEPEDAAPRLTINTVPAGSGND